MFVLQSVVITVADPLELHTTKPLAGPAVEVRELRGDCRERSREVSRHASNDRVDPRYGLGIEVATADGQFPDPVLVFLHGLLSHSTRLVVKVKPQEGESFAEGRDLRLLVAEIQPEFRQA